MTQPMLAPTLSDFDRATAREPVPDSPGDFTIMLDAGVEIQTSSGGLAVEHGRIALPDGTPVAESFPTRLTARD